jgi:hypothetical protein
MGGYLRGGGLLPQAERRDMLGEYRTKALVPRHGRIVATSIAEQAVVI